MLVCGSQCGLPPPFICTTFYASRCWDISLGSKNFDLLVVLRIRPLGTMIIWIKSHNNPCSCWWNISAWTKVLDFVNIRLTFPHSHVTQLKSRPDFYAFMPTSICTTAYVTLCTPPNEHIYHLLLHPRPPFLHASRYQWEWMWEAESFATGGCALALWAWSLIQWGQRSSTHRPFITMTPCACQQRRYVGAAGRAREGLMSVIADEFQPITRSRNYH